MKLEVNFVAGLEKMIPESTYDKKILIDVPENATVYDLLKILKLPDYIVVLINGTHAHLSHVLKPNDKVILFPPIAGG